MFCKLTGRRGFEIVNCFHFSITMYLFFLFSIKSFILFYSIFVSGRIVISYWFTASLTCLLYFQWFSVDKDEGTCIRVVAFCMPKFRTLIGSLSTKNVEWLIRCLTNSCLFSLPSFSFLYLSYFLSLLPKQGLLVDLSQRRTLVTNSWSMGKQWRNKVKNL